MGKVLARHEDLSSILRTHVKKPGVVAHIRYLDNGEVESRGFLGLIN